MIESGKRNCHYLNRMNTDNDRKYMIYLEVLGHSFDGDA